MIRDRLHDLGGHGRLDRGLACELVPLQTPGAVRLELAPVHADEALGRADQVAHVRVFEELGRVLRDDLHHDDGADRRVGAHDVPRDGVLRGEVVAADALLDDARLRPGRGGLRLDHLGRRGRLTGGATVAVEGAVGTLDVSLQGTLSLFSLALHHYGKACKY